MFYQCDGGSKLSIDVISDTNALRALVKEHLSSTIGSGMLLYLNFVRTKRRHFVTVSSLEKLLYGIIIFRVDTKVNNDNGVTMKLQR